MTIDKLLIATTNAGKRDEFQALLRGLPFACVMLDDVGLSGMDVAETGETYVDNAMIKARTYAKMSGLVTLADDSGIAVDVLNGGPGIYSARYATTAAERNTKLIAALNGRPPDQRGARFKCAIVVTNIDNHAQGTLTLIGEGHVNGWVGYAPRGTNGHGYDPVFVLPDGRTMAELDATEKNMISHRGRALATILPVLHCLFPATTRV